MKETCVLFFKFVLHIFHCQKPPQGSVRHAAAQDGRLLGRHRRRAASAACGVPALPLPGERQAVRARHHPLQGVGAADHRGVGQDRRIESSTKDASSHAGGSEGHQLQGRRAQEEGGLVQQVQNFTIVCVHPVDVNSEQ